MWRARRPPYDEAGVGLDLKKNFSAVRQKNLNRKIEK